MAAVELTTDARFELTRGVRGRLTIRTHGPRIHDISNEAQRWVSETGAGEGILNAIILHTSASLVVQENADDNVKSDLLVALNALAPREALYSHAEEGPDDMPSHIKSMVTDTSITFPVADGKIVFGRWQGLFLVEHRDAPRERTVILQYVGS